MADTKISALTSGGTVVGTEQFPANDGGTTKEYSADEIIARCYQPSIESLTIASGIIALTGISGNPPTVHIVTSDTEASASADDLDSVTGGTDGDILILRQVSSARDITIKHLSGGTGQFTLSGGIDRTLGTLRDTALFFYDGASSVWRELPTS